MEFKFYEETIANTKDLYAGSPEIYVTCLPAPLSCLLGFYTIKAH